jgi:DNA polymerase-3 subunit gamma/tau
MTYQVLARKWRPQTFETVVGQDAITRTLRNAIASGRIAHGYLFAGPRGIGKTTTARLLAKALLCPERTGPEPCEACAVCREATAGTLTDIIEVDAASNRKIDDIRTLRENVKYAPSRGRYKVYIIDEVHQLTSDAFDALLKTLEEPPPHVVFVLATTDPRDVPPTILSRVQRFDFRPIPPDLMVKSLEHILEEEKIPFDHAALPVVVRAAEGSLRDALSLLDTAIAYGSGKLEAATVAEVLGATAPAEVMAYCGAVLGHETAPALEAIDRAAARGDDLQAFARDAIEALRRVLVLRAAPTTQLADLSASEANAYRKLGEAVALDEVLYVLRAFLEADEMMRQSPHPRVELEIATVKATRRPVPHALDDLLRRIDEAQARLGQVAPTAGASVQASLLGGPATDARPAIRPAGPARTPAPQDDATESGSPPPRPVAADEPRAAGRGASGRAPASSFAPPATARGSDVTASPAPAASPAPVAISGPAASATGEETTAPERIDAPAGDLATLWQRIAEEVMSKKPMLGTVLGQVRVLGVRNGALMVAMAGNQFQRGLLNDRTNRDVVMTAVRRYLRGVERLEVADGEAAPPSDVRSHPAVQAALAEFEGEVVAVRPRQPEGEGQ